jgi:hypothetical protein
MSYSSKEDCIVKHLEERVNAVVIRAGRIGVSIIENSGMYAILMLCLN